MLLGEASILHKPTPLSPSIIVANWRITIVFLVLKLSIAEANCRALGIQSLISIQTLEGFYVPIVSLGFLVSSETRRYC